MDINKKTIPLKSRDQTRNYSGIILQELLLNAGYRCSHPYCDSPYFSLNAHHIIFHSHGGLTVKLNGLILCARCHRLLHEGPIPRQLAYNIKYWIDSGRTVPFIIEGVSPDELGGFKKNFDNIKMRDFT